MQLIAYRDFWDEHKLRFGSVQKVDYSSMEIHVLQWYRSTRRLSPKPSQVSIADFRGFVRDPAFDAAAGRARRSPQAIQHDEEAEQKLAEAFKDTQVLVQKLGKAPVTLPPQALNQEPTEAAPGMIEVIHAAPGDAP